ncbi:Transferase [Arabidopsis suecica]|uniref:Transferase n=1 Tax=Arabidopsis suecica TaxID=45249 RepID=A0A8T2A4V5_ARASU|nr:Transferase [Arabidopsis suecica]
MIKRAKAKLPEEFEKFVNGDGDDPFAPEVGYNTLFLSEWGKLGFNQVDYGWGPPLHVAPIQGLSIVPAGIVGSMPLPKKGVRLMTWCVEETHCQLFDDLMTNKISTSNKTE